MNSSLRRARVVQFLRNSDGLEIRNSSTLGSSISYVMNLGQET